MIKVEFVVTALIIARLANIGVSRPVDHSVPSLVELQKLHPEFTVVKNPELSVLLFFSLLPACL